MATTQQETLSIDGMHCEHCVEAVRKVLSDVPGVSVESVAIGTATVSRDGSVSSDQLAAALDDVGYELAT